MAGPIDHIDGDPQAMKSYNLAGPYMTDPKGDIGTMMAEGVKYVVNDRKAIELLDKFVQDASEGFQAYNFQATRAGYNYLAADEGAAAKINGVLDSKAV